MVDDDAVFREFTSVALSAAGHEHVLAADGEECLRILEQNARGAIDLVLLDLSMPGVSGWDLIVKIRESGNEIPIIFVTASDDVRDRVRGLRMGADDYLAKPVEYDELIARIEAVIRRRSSLPTVEFGDLRVDLARRRVERGGRVIELTPREYDVLLALVQLAGETATRTALLRDIWDLDASLGSNLVEVHITRIRRKLGDPPMVETVRGQGYRLHRDQPITD